MYALSIVIGIALFLTCPFHLLGDDSNPDYGEKDPDFCPAPGYPTIRAPDWVCMNFDNIDGYSEFGFGSSILSSPEHALAMAIEDLAIQNSSHLDIRSSTINTDTVTTTSTTKTDISAKITAKVVRTFFTPTGVYILVAAAPDGNAYEVTSNITTHVYEKKFNDGSILIDLRKAHFIRLDTFVDNTFSPDTRFIVTCSIFEMEGEKLQDKELNAEKCLDEEVEKALQELYLDWRENPKGVQRTAEALREEARKEEAFWQEMPQQDLPISE